MSTLAKREGTVEPQMELFALAADSRLADLRGWIKCQWVFVHVFWPTEAQIVRIADAFKVLCEIVIAECDAEFIRHCDVAV